MIRDIAIFFVVAGCLLIVAISCSRAPSVPVKRWVDANFNWSVASYSDGRWVHILPEGDGQLHVEDHDGDCPCGPAVNHYERTSGGTGWLIVHRTTTAEARR